MTARPQAIVVGAGLGGLATAVRLAGMGLDVTVLERLETPGGVCTRVVQDGYSIDVGPTLLVMRDVVERLFADAGRPMEDYLTLRRLDPNYRVHFPDGEHLDFLPDRGRMAAELDRLEPGAGDRFHALMDEMAGAYRLGRATMLERNFRTLADYAAMARHPLEGLSLVLRGSLDERLGRFFRDQRLRDAFGFQTLYLGMTPYDSPALYGQLACMELEEGLWFPEGGMSSIADALVRLAMELGVTFRFQADVVGVDTEQGRASAVRLGTGERLVADLVVLNASVPTAYQELLPGTPPASHARLRVGASVAVMALGIEGTVPGLLHHNLFLPRDTRTSYHQVCVDNVLPDDLFLYVCSPSVTQSELSPPDGQSLFLLTMAPNLQNPLDWEAAAPRLRERMLDRFAAAGFGDLRGRIRVERMITPADFHARQRAGFGNPFGYTHHLTQMGYFRPHNRHESLPNVYFVGANTHPGGGVPIVLLSAKLVTDRIRTEQPALVR